MIGYQTVGTNDLKKAAKFYDELLKELGAERMMESEGFIAWSTGPGTAGFSIIIPFDGNPATVGNGCMTAFLVDNPEKVDQIHTKAIELNGKCEGEPGYRMDGFYAAYFRDLDGNKLNAFCFEHPK